MGSYYSILRFVNNSISNENIALGLIAISDSKLYFKASQKKISISKNLNPSSSKLLDFSLKQLIAFIKNDKAKEKSHLFFNKKDVDIDYLIRLSNYHNGILQFSKPVSLPIDLNEVNFEQYFAKIVNADDAPEKIQKSDSLLKRNIKSKIHIPLKNKIDLKYTIQKKHLPTLFFDFEFDAIGVNGSIYAAKSIDINFYSTSSPIEKTLSEYESIIDRLNNFALSNNIANNDPKFYLILDKYLGKKKEMLEIYNDLHHSKMPHFQIIESEKAEVFSNIVIQKKAHKFSDILI